MAHAQKPDFVFRRNGRVHLNRRGRHLSRLLAAEACASAVVMLDTPCSEVVWEYWLLTPFASFPFTSPPVRHRVPLGFKRTLPTPAIGRYEPDRHASISQLNNNVCLQSSIFISSVQLLLSSPKTFVSKTLQVRLVSLNTATYSTHFHPPDFPVDLTQFSFTTLLFD
jgi:hypothetical protein